jgi:hypothetical protein
MSEPPPKNNKKPLPRLGFSMSGSPFSFQSSSFQPPSFSWPRPPSPTLADLPPFTVSHKKESNNNNTSESANVLAPLGIFNRASANTAMLGMSLRPSASTATAEYESMIANQRRQEQDERNKSYKAPFTDELVAQIMTALTSCPKDEFATRVFRQHTGMGLCWHDSFFMMVFENQHTKAEVIELLKGFFFELQKRNITNLEFTKEKTQQVAKGLRDRFGASLPIGTWEMVTLALQRYALLGLLFVKEGAELSKPKAVETSRLLNRRPSIGEMNFDYIHDLLKYGVMTCFDSGASVGGIWRFMNDMGGFLETFTKGKYRLESATGALEPTNTVGYYFSIQTNPDMESPSGFVGGAHIISVFLCDDHWYLYDNETGVLPLSDEVSSQISEHGIESMQMMTTQANLFKYPITLGNKTVVTVEMPHEYVQSHYGSSRGNYLLRARTVLGSSYRMVKVPTKNGGAKTKTRRQKKRQYQKRKSSRHYRR